MGHRLALPLSDLKPLSLSACEGMEPESTQHDSTSFHLFETSPYIQPILMGRNETPQALRKEFLKLPRPVCQPQSFTFPPHAEPTHGSGHYEGDHDPTPGRQKQEDAQFKTSMGNIHSESKHSPLLTSSKTHQLQFAVVIQDCLPEKMTERTSKARARAKSTRIQNLHLLRAQMQPDSPSSVAPGARYPSIGDKPRTSTLLFKVEGEGDGESHTFVPFELLSQSSFSKGSPGLHYNLQESWTFACCIPSPGVRMLS